jgi:hypothetical protein
VPPARTLDAYPKGNRKYEDWYGDESPDGGKHTGVSEGLRVDCCSLFP